MGDDKVLQLMVSLKACADEALRVDRALCARACRGQIRESGEQGALEIVGELEEMRCTLAGVSLRPYLSLGRAFAAKQRLLSLGVVVHTSRNSASFSARINTCAFAHTTGHKPLTLLHRFFPEARNLAALCRAGVHTSEARYGGPTLVFLRGEKHRARAHAAGAPFMHATSRSSRCHSLLPNDCSSLMMRPQRRRSS